MKIKGIDDAFSSEAIITIKADANRKEWNIEFRRLMTDPELMDLENKGLAEHGPRKELKGFVPGTYEIYLSRIGTSIGSIVQDNWRYQSGGAEVFLEKAEEVLEENLEVASS